MPRGSFLSLKTYLLITLIPEECVCPIPSFIFYSLVIDLFLSGRVRQFMAIFLHQNLKNFIFSAWFCHIVLELCHFYQTHILLALGENLFSKVTPSLKYKSKIFQVRNAFPSQLYPIKQLFCDFDKPLAWLKSHSDQKVKILHSEHIRYAFLSLQTFFSKHRYSDCDGGPRSCYCYLSSKIGYEYLKELFIFLKFAFTLLQ